jgi:hypothetical protein
VPTPPSPVEQVIDAHLRMLRSKILVRAVELSTQDSAGVVPDGAAVGIAHVAQAIAEYAPGTPVNRIPDPGVRFWDVVSPVTVISTGLCVVFAAFGLWAVLGERTAIHGQSYLDIAKIFAGAIVGSTGAVVSSALARSRATKPTS